MSSPPARQSFCHQKTTRGQASPKQEPQGLLQGTTPQDSQDPPSHLLPYPSNALARFDRLNDSSVPNASDPSCQITFNSSAKPQAMMHTALHCTAHTLTLS